LQQEVDPQQRGELGKGRVLREGGDVTLVTWSRMVHPALEAAEQAMARGISAEVIDLRTIWPWDRDLVFASAAKTGRLLVVHEAVRTAGFGAEIAAEAAEHLAIPVKRLGSPRIPVGYSKPLEDEARLGSGEIVKSLEEFTQQAKRLGGSR
jgi:pyruvate dehydrogenase E1 component beta subunit